MEEYVESVTNRPTFRLLTVQDFRNRIFPRYARIQDDQGNEKIATAFDHWFKWNGRREYEGIGLYPDQAYPDMYNLWQGFAFTPQPGDWGLLKQHILQIVCNNDEAIFKWVLDWIADMVQDPSNIPGVSLVLRGGQGTGKGTLFRAIGRLFGNHYQYIAHSTLLVGRFNWHLSSAVFTFVDEAIWAGDKAGEGQLKALITEPYITYEQKGKDPILLKNHNHFGVASNHDWVVPCGKDERRFAVLDINEEVKQDQNWFKAIHEQMDNGGYAAFLHEMLNREYDKSTLRRIPKTPALVNQIEKTMETAEQFILRNLRRGHWLNNSSQWEDEVPCEKLWEEYVDYAGKIGANRRSTEIELGTAIKKMCPSFSKYRGTDKSGNRCRIWKASDTATARSEFESIIGIKYDWESEQDDSFYQF